MPLPQEQVQLIRAEAVAVVKQHLRAEARAQATIAKKELADQFNAILKQDRAPVDKLEKSAASLAEAIARLTVLADVLVDLAVGEFEFFNEKTPEDRRKAFYRMCEAKKKSFEAQA